MEKIRFLSCTVLLLTLFAFIYDVVIFSKYAPKTTYKPSSFYPIRDPIISFNKSLIFSAIGITDFWILFWNVLLTVVLQITPYIDKSPIFLLHYTLFMVIVNTASMTFYYIRCILRPVRINPYQEYSDFYDIFGRMASPVYSAGCISIYLCLYFALRVILTFIPNETINIRLAVKIMIFLLVLIVSYGLVSLRGATSGIIFGLTVLSFLALAIKTKRFRDGLPNKLKYYTLWILLEVLIAISFLSYMVAADDEYNYFEGSYINGTWSPDSDRCSLDNTDNSIYLASQLLSFIGPILLMVIDPNLRRTCLEKFFPQKKIPLDGNVRERLLPDNHIDGVVKNENGVSNNMSYGSTETAPHGIRDVYSAPHGMRDEDDVYSAPHGTREDDVYSAPHGMRDEDDVYSAPHGTREEDENFMPHGTRENDDEINSGSFPKGFGYGFSDTPQVEGLSTKDLVEAFKKGLISEQQYLNIKEVNGENEIS